MIVWIRVIESVGRRSVPSTRFLFWNINGKPLADLIGHIAYVRAIDIIILAESDISAVDMLRSLNRQCSGGFRYCAGFNATIEVFVRFSPGFLQPRFDADRVSIRHLTLPARSTILLAMVHLPSKLRWSNDSQAIECTELARRIAIEEDKVGHRRTILVGDLNMNPFETGMVAAGGLNSVPTRRLAAREVRTVQGREYSMFYNPMWGHFGDRQRDTAGSYFYSSSEHVNYFWHIFDQVLLRPELAQQFDPGTLEIISSLSDRSLVHADGRPDSSACSDHLPIVFELNF
jgi:hypothetical protein